MRAPPKPPVARSPDIASRYGGDEFVFILPRTGVREALQVAERLRAGVEEHLFLAGDALGHGIKMTVTLGVATFPCVPSPASHEELLSRADSALLHAKLCGKNCVQLYKPDSKRALVKSS